MRCCRIAILVLSMFASVAARAEERLPTIPPAQYIEQQKQAAADFEAARKVPVFGPFERAKSRLGMKGVVDMTGIVGYYTFLAMQLNVAQYPAARVR
jgi:hypothetical protein